ncbi:MAG TPA: hypothetical protein PLY40_03890, partial [Bacillota bacterium]|nr:hypothetical protein [Bacillota bacterium]
QATSFDGTSIKPGSPQGRLSTSFARRYEQDQVLNENAWPGNLTQQNESKSYASPGLLSLAPHCSHYSHQ